jgi:heat shock protein HtpX
MTTTKQSSFGATLRTTILLASLTGLLVVIGALLGGPSTAGLFLGIALLINLGSYFFSDKLALKMSRAQPIDESEAPRLYQIVRELTTRAGLPMPRLYMIPQDQPNAFATGRNPKHSAVAVTRGITKLLSEDELRGVLAHELTHIRNRDISPLSLVASLAMVLLAPIAASIIQLSISRQREFAADAGGAEICGNPESLASALLRLEQGAQAIPMKVNQAAEPLYIVKPFRGGGVAALFSTHPPIEERVRRLRQMRPTLG